MSRLAGLVEHIHIHINVKLSCNFTYHNIILKCRNGFIGDTGLEIKCDVTTCFLLQNG